MAVLVGKQAPDFSVQAVQEGKVIDHFNLSQFKQQKYVVLFFYPFDFTFVCPTELHEFQNKAAEFKQLNAQIVAASTDSVHSHMAWMKIGKDHGGIQGISYPILSDYNKIVSIAYDVLTPMGMSLRGTFIIDKEQIVQHQVVNNLALGRSIDNTLSTLEALQMTEKHGEVCPANWQKGKSTMKATAEGVSQFFRG